MLKCLWCPYLHCLTLTSPLDNQTSMGVVNEFFFTLINCLHGLVARQWGSHKLFAWTGCRTVRFTYIVCVDWLPGSGFQSNQSLRTNCLFILHQWSLKCEIIDIRK